MVIKWRPAVGVGLIWLVAVAGVSVTAWVAIDRAGRGITGGLVNSLSPLTVGTTPVTPGDGGTATEGTTHPSAGPGTANTPEPSPTAMRSADNGPSASPTSVAVPGATAARDRTFSATGGQVSVRCTGNRIQLRIAQPDDGYRVEVVSAGPDDVHVNFRPGDDEGGGGTQVTAVCATGVPVFRVASQS